MKTIIHKSALSTALVASGLVMHLGVAFAAGSGDFNTNIAVTSAACRINTDAGDESPFTATASFDAAQFANNAPPTMNVSPGVRAVTVSSNCPLLGITMTPSVAPKFTGVANTKNVAIVATSDGQWPVDFFWSNFEVYTTGSDTPDLTVKVNLGNGGYTAKKTYTVGDTPVVHELSIKAVAPNDPGYELDASGQPIMRIFTAPMYQYQTPDGEMDTSWTTNSAYRNNTDGRINEVKLVPTLADGNKNKFVAYVGAMFGTQPYGNDGLPNASAVANGETVTLSRVLTVTAS